jgi:uncharacterized protein (TIGR03382 family)
MTKLAQTTIVAIALLLAGGPARAATVTVTNGSDSGAGSLRQAILDTVTGDDIVFSGVTAIVLTSDHLSIDKNLTIDGGTGVTILRGSGTLRIFQIQVGATVHLSNLAISNGVTSAFGRGGGIQNFGTATLTACRILSNSAYNGGGVTNDGGSITFVGCVIDNNSTTGNSGAGLLNSQGTMTLLNCTVSDNHATGADRIGGGIVTTSSTAAAVTIISHSTIAGNTAPAQGGGLWIGGLTSTLTLKNTIVAGNGALAGPDIYGAIHSLNYNLIEDVTGAVITGSVANNITGLDPLLGALADNGGPTPTRALASTSPAINAGDCADVLGNLVTVDQRGVARPQGLQCDIGAFEIVLCGNGVVDGNEECDDGAANSDTLPDACRTTCTLPGCGDSTLDTAESCDDGNTDDGDGCSGDCLSDETCGNGVVDGGEACDEGAANSDTDPDACRVTCVPASCGDAVVDSGETCDDGNTGDGDGCSAVCLAELACGDGVVDGDEACDDGVSNSDTDPDACRTTCVRAGCGDGVVDAAEACDDGNTADGDGCSGTCQEETSDSADADGCGCSSHTPGLPAPPPLIVLLAMAAWLLRRRTIYP